MVLRFRSGSSKPGAVGGEHLAQSTADIENRWHEPAG